MTGALLVDKPAGVTSHDVVAGVRRERGGKVGHAGTLDPFATGLLVVLLGRATRLQRYLLELPKTYLATARLGWRSTTGDPDGELTETGVVPESLQLPTGEIEQKLPLTSAVKVDGERLYKKAHRGEDFDTPTRRATVHRAELLEHDGETATYEIECSSGTYVRTLIETLGDAYCERLERTKVGDLELRRGEEVEVSAAEMVAFLPERPLDDDEAAAVRHGRPVPARDETGEAVRLTHGEDLVAIGRPVGQNLRPEVVLEPA